MPGSRLDFCERAQIAVMLEAGASLRMIGRVLGRAHTTIAREVAGDRDRGGRYYARRAELAARRRRARPKALRLQQDPVLRAEVGTWLGKRCSPEQAVGRLAREHPGDPRWKVSHTAVYNAIYVLGRKGLNAELDVALRSGRARRVARAGTKSLRGRIPGMVSIAERPFAPQDRSVPGHWEGDLVIGKASKSAVATLVERTSRFMAAASLPDGKGAEQVAAGVAAAMVDLPESLRRSLTWDRGKEMSGHARFTVDTGIAVYFADPHSPWQRGTNENFNGLLREYFPKGTDFTTVTDADLQAAIAELNDRPRKILDFATPAEAFQEMIQASLVQ